MVFRHARNLVAFNRSAKFWVIVTHLTVFHNFARQSFPAARKIISAEYDTKKSPLSSRKILVAKGGISLYEIIATNIALFEDEIRMG